MIQKTNQYSNYCNLEEKERELIIEILSNNKKFLEISKNIVHFHLLDEEYETISAYYQTVNGLVDVTIWKLTYGVYFLQLGEKDYYILDEINDFKNIQL